MKRPKRPKTIAAMLLAGFLAFAPPGTLIACAALVMALFGYCAGSRDKNEAAPQTQQTQQVQQPALSASPTPGATPAP